jgi:hypothetical protein
MSSSGEILSTSKARNIRSLYCLFRFFAVIQFVLQRRLDGVLEKRRCGADWLLYNLLFTPPGEICFRGGRLAQGMGGSLSFA